MTSSVAHHYAKLEMDKINTPRACGHQVLYNNSKLCNVLSANELARRLEGTGMHFISFNVAWVYSIRVQTLPAMLDVIVQMAIRKEMNESHSKSPRAYTEMQLIDTNGHS